MELDHFSHSHKLILNETNRLDADEEISCLCQACGLPIFSTPSYTCSAGCNFFLHKRCAHLPQKLKHVLRGFLSTGHLSGSLADQNNFSCNNCGRKCGNIVWSPTFLQSTWEPISNFYLDAICAVPLEIRIFHRSHEHVLIPVQINGEDLVICCAACGDRQRGLFYWCCLCSFWIHENCASSPNYIRHLQHSHPLALTYALPRDKSYCCGICQTAITSLGVYFCGVCSYYAHIKCAVSSTEHFESASSREIGEPSYWIHFPMADENQSLVVHLLQKTICIESREENDSTELHEHPLIFHPSRDDGASDGDDHQHLPLLPPRALCNACVQPISSTPFYSCSQCSDYFLHNCCANLPLSIHHPSHEDHPLVLFRGFERSIGFFCRGCGTLCNGFAYGCQSCDFYLDIECTFLPNPITHQVHDKRHVLLLNHKINQGLFTDCCGSNLGEFNYKCSSCDFGIHSFCACLPLSVRHKFDKHPLKLISRVHAIIQQDNYHYVIAGPAPRPTKQQQQLQLSYSDENFCEICENKIQSEHWYYGCFECNQSFHIACIPFLDGLTKFKFGGGIRVWGHHHPLTSVNLRMVGRNYKCQDCYKPITGLAEGLAFECSKCDYWIHEDCAKTVEMTSWNWKGLRLVGL